jgi:hypothetical protein
MAFTLVDAYHIIAVASVLLGLLSCFAGYRLFRFLLALTGFAFFLTLGFVIVYYFITPSILVATIVGSVLATFGSVFVSCFPSFGAFLLGSFFGGSLSVVLISLVKSSYMQQDDTRDITILSFSIMVGTLAIHYRRVAILAGTAAFGAFALLSGFDHFAQSGFSSILSNFANGNKIHPNTMMIIFIVSFFILSIAGAFVQLKIMSPQTLHSFTNYYKNFSINSSSSSSSSSYSYSNSSFSRFLRLLPCKRKVDEVPLLDVVALEDY